MADFIPPAATLLKAATDYLEHELLPVLSGYHRFQTRISINVLRTVMRELQFSTEYAAAEHGRLAALLGHDGELAVLNRELAEAIATGCLDLDAPGLVEHLRRTLRDALAINSPNWIEADSDANNIRSHFTSLDTEARQYHNGSTTSPKT